MIAHLIRFDSEAAAKADPVCGAYWHDATADAPGTWRPDVCIAGVTVWPAADPAHPLPYWYLWIASAAVIAALRDHPAMVMVVDWAGPALVASPLTPAQLLQYEISTVFAGCDVAGLRAALEAAA